VSLAGLSHFLGHTVFSVRCKILGKRGQALVETALVFPILLTFLIGVTELARVERASIVVSNAAKAGAQYAAQNGSTAQDTTGIFNAASAEGAGYSIDTTSSYTCVCSDGSDSTCLQTDCSNSHIEQTVTVNTQTSVTPLIRLPGLPSTWTIKGQAIQRCLQ